MTRTTIWIRLAASLLLVGALLFPLSRCSEGTPVVSGSTGAPAPAAPSSHEGAAKTYRYYYAWSDMHAGEPVGWLFLLVFFWPGAVLFYRRFAPQGRVQRALAWAEPALVLGSGYWLFVHTFMRDLWIGGYLAFAGLGLLFLASILDAGRAILKRRRGKGSIGVQE